MKRLFNEPASLRSNRDATLTDRQCEQDPSPPALRVARQRPKRRGAETTGRPAPLPRTGRKAGQLIVRMFLIIAVVVAVGALAVGAQASQGFTIVDLGTLGGSYSDGVAINPSGQVVGSSYTAAGSQHAFSWTQAGGVGELGAPWGPPRGVPPGQNGGGGVGV